MAGPAQDDRWRRILELADAAADLPAAERRKFVESESNDPQIVSEALKLAEKFQVPSDEPALDAGGQLGRFTITARIGRGGMGEVFAAHDPDLQRTVALKVLTRERGAVAGSTNQMVREARTASALNHPNIVTVYEVVRTGATFALVMEFVPGASLRAMMGQRISGNQYVRIARQIASALESAHAAGIVHRDIKPENVIVRPDGHVKVLDFGLARSLNRNQDSLSGSWSQAMAGTVGYMSPEQCLGEAMTPASDTFSLGLVLYELAAGRHPFPAGSAFETMQAIVSRTPEPLTSAHMELPAGLNTLILSMLSKAPSYRPATAEVARSLEEIHWASRDSDDSPGRPAPLRSPAHRRPTPGIRLWVAAALFVAVIVSLLIWKAYSSGQRLVDFVQITSLVPANRATAAAISRDGKFLAYANADGIFVRTMQTWETHQLRSPNDLIVDHIAWYADGATLAVSGFSARHHRPSIWTISITASEPRMMRAEARYAAPSPDGRSLAFLSENRSEIWVGGAGGEEPVKVLSAGMDDSFTCLFWSASGRSLLFQRRHLSKRDLGGAQMDRFYQRSLESVDAQSGNIAFSVRDFWFDSGVALPDGRLRFLRFESPGDHYSNELWEVKADRDTGAFRGSPRKLGNPVELRGGFVRDMSSTDDGTRAMVIRSTDEDAVFVAEYQHDPPRFLSPVRLTLDSRRSFPHAWTRDSSAVIFESHRNGAWDIFLQRMDQRMASAIVANPARAEVLPQLTPDGNSILYATGPTDATGDLNAIMRAPLEGGAPVQVPIGGPLGQFRCSPGARGRCVLRRADHASFVFHELDPVRGIGRELIRTEWMPEIVGDWDISPDGLKVAVPNHDPKSAVIHVIRLDGAPGDRETEINLPGLSDLAGLTWAADGGGWFVSFYTTIGKRMAYAYPDGRVLAMGNIEGPVVPAPNGQRVAYLDRIVAADAWEMILK